MQFVIIKNVNGMYWNATNGCWTVAKSVASEYEISDLPFELDDGLVFLDLYNLSTDPLAAQYYDDNDIDNAVAGIEVV